MIPRMRRLTLVLLSPLLAASFLAAQSARAPEIDSITAREMRADLFFLASDAMQGRLTNTPANRIAADWVLSRFERLGLQPGGHDGSFEHRYALMTASLGERQRDAHRRAAESSRHTLGLSAVGEEFYPHRFSANAAVEGAVDVRRLRHRLAGARARRLPRRRRAVASRSSSIANRA